MIIIWWIFLEDDKLPFMGIVRRACDYIGTSARYSFVYQLFIEKEVLLLEYNKIMNIKIHIHRWWCFLVLCIFLVLSYIGTLSANDNPNCHRKPINHYLSDMRSLWDTSLTDGCYMITLLCVLSIISKIEF